MRTIFIAIAAWASVASTSWAETPPTDAAFVAKAEAAVETYVKDGRFSGAVLVARDGKPILREGFGLADREWDVAVTPDAEFRLGSITKQFTATAVLQLVQQGKIGLDDPISKYYAAAPAAWSKVTIRHLLTHRSGIPSYTDIPAFFDKEARLDRTPEEIIALTRDKALQFEPGSKYSYDNSGYILLGYVIEKVSGQPYADYLQGHVFGPLGMAHSGYDVSATVLHHRAAGYLTGKDGVVQNAPFLAMSLPYAAGSLYSNVDDLLTWDQALYAAKPLTAASLADMFTDHGDHYGYGWEINQTDGRRVWSHNGGINGFHTFIARYPDQKLTVIVLSNLMDAPVEKIGAALIHLNFGEPLEPQAKPGETPHAGAEAALHRVIGELAKGAPDYDRMGPKLAELIRPRAADFAKLIQGFGAVQSTTFVGRGEGDVDQFVVKFERNSTLWRIGLDASSHIVTLLITPN